MEILTLLKANIRHKKGAFKSIIILMFIITASMTAIISTNDNIHKSLTNAIHRIQAGDLIAWLDPMQDTAAICEELDKNEFVKSYRIDNVLLTNDQIINGNKTNKQSYELQKWTQDFPVYNENQTAFWEQPEALKAGEAYVPLSFTTLYDCKLGSKIEIITNHGTRTLTIKGFVEEPFLGAYMIGIKSYFISDADFQLFMNENVDIQKKENARLMPHKQVHIFQKESNSLTSSKFKKSVNESSGIIDLAVLSFATETSMEFTTMFTDILSGILYAFLILLFVIVVVMICHSISSGIEMDYTNLGILKAMGFTKKKICTVYILQYMLAQLIGILLGLIASYPLSLFLRRLFLPITGILTGTGISFGKILPIISAMILLVYIAVILLTRKVARISPVRAISGGRHSIYFNSRITLPLHKKMLSFTLALRQFTSNKKQYAGTLFISAILVFFMMSINLLINCMSSDGVLGNMGIEIYDVEAQILDASVLEKLEDIKMEIEEITPVKTFTAMNSSYITLDGSDIHCTFYMDPSIPEKSILKGRCPLYDNECIITTRIAEEYNLQIGDTVTLSDGTKHADYIISGLHQSTMDTGRCITMSYDAYKKIGNKTCSYLGITLADEAASKEVTSMLNNSYKDEMEANLYGDDSTFIIDLALKGIGMLIYCISVLFTFVTVNMVCKRSFLKERTDIGIYKAVGFTVRKLRLQFTLRFLTVSLFGSLLGILLCLVCCKPMLELLLSNMGITNFITEYTLSTILIPVILTGTCFFLFSYLASRKIKQVAVTELIVE